jgi:hypothetical protein
MSRREKGEPEAEASAPPSSSLDLSPAARANLEPCDPCNSEMQQAYWEPASIPELDERLKTPSAVRPPRLEARWARRARLPSVKRIERESGKTVASITVAPDGSRTYAFGQPEAAKEEAPAEEPPRTTLFKARLVPKQKVIL